MIITGCAYIFAWFITAKQLPQLLIQVMNTFITSKTAFLIFLNIALFLVGMFMESFSAIIVLMPILFPVATAYGIDPIHFGVIVSHQPGDWIRNTALWSNFIRCLWIDRQECKRGIPVCNSYDSCNVSCTDYCYISPADLFYGCRS